MKAKPPLHSNTPARSGRGARAQQRTEAIVNAPIGPTLLRLTLPMIAGIISLMLLGLVDSYFVGQLGLDELAALGFTLPVISSAHGIALGVGMALSVLISRMLGAGNIDQAARTISDGRYLTIAVAIIMQLLLWLFFEPLFKMLGAGVEVMPHIRDYMFIWLPSIPLMFLNITGNTVLRAAGSPAKSAFLLFMVALLNGIFDPIFIFGFGPIPGMGMIGASLATVLAWMITYAISVFMLGYQEKLLVRTLPSWPSLLESWRKLMRIGVPAVCANLMTPVAAGVLTAMMAGFGTSAVAGFGVAIRVEAVCLMIAFALSSTLPMFIGQNLGAGKIERVRRALYGSLGFVLIFQTLVYLGLRVLPAIGPLFSEVESVVAIINDYLLLVPLTYGGHAVVILVMVSLNAMNQPRIALAVTTLRLALINLPLAYVGAQLYSTLGLFVGYALGNIISGILAFVIMRRVWRRDVGVLATHI
ncbi:MAG: MATE family efflux transporter [Porticoccaceae bacterium]